MAIHLEYDLVNVDGNKSHGIVNNVFQKHVEQQLTCTVAYIHFHPRSVAVYPEIRTHKIKRGPEPVVSR